MAEEYDKTISRDQYYDQLSLSELDLECNATDNLREQLNPNRKMLIVDDQPYNIQALKIIL